MTNDVPPAGAATAAAEAGAAAGLGAAAGAGTAGAGVGTAAGASVFTFSMLPSNFRAGAALAGATESLGLEVRLGSTSDLPVRALSAAKSSCS